MDIKMNQAASLSNICELNEFYSDKFKKYVKTIIDYFGAVQLHFDRLTYDGKLWCLHTNPESFRSYVLECDGFKNDPICKDARLIKSNIIVWPSQIASPAKPEGLKEYLYVDHGVTFIYFDQKGCYGLAFGGLRQNNYLVNMLLKEIRLITDFKNYLITELHDVISEMDKHTFPVAQYVGDNFYQDTNFFGNRSLTDKADLLLKTKRIEEKDLELLNIHLSRREKQCALLCLRKHTIEEIGSILGISMNTIKRVMFELKERLHVNKKRDLLTVLKKLEQLDYFAGEPFFGAD